MRAVLVAEGDVDYIWHSAEFTEAEDGENCCKGRSEEFRMFSKR
jgi:hypothetical protein